MSKIEKMGALVFTAGMMFMASCVAADAGAPVPVGEGSQGVRAAAPERARAGAAVEVEEDLDLFPDAALHPDLLAGRDWPLDPVVAKAEQDIGTEAISWTSYVSEEDPPATCWSGRLATGFDCNGSYCDRVALECDSAAPTSSYGSRVWTSWFSEESTNYRICGNGRYVTGIACNHSYCDNISLECTSTGLGAYDCQWSGYFSEEDPTFYAPAGRFIKGVQCNGSYCDNKRFYHCSP